MACHDDQPVRVLPKGRHRLSRGEVSASQRGRILAAVVDVVAEHGYARTSVAAVVERAGASSKAFSEHVAGRDPASRRPTTRASGASSREHAPRGPGGGAARPPGSPEEIGRVNALITSAIGRAAGTRGAAAPVHDPRPPPAAVPALAAVRRARSCRAAGSRAATPSS